MFPYDNQFWDDEADEMWKELDDIILGIYLFGSQEGIDALPTSAQSLVNFDFINSAVIDYAKTYRYGFIKDITDTTRTQVQKSVSDWLLSGQPLSALETQLTSVFGEARAKQIAITETTRVTAEGNTQAWQSTGLVNEVTFHTTEDDRVCPYCSPLDGQTFDVDDYGHKPPIHPGCRCYSQPVLDDEVVSSAIDEALQ